MQTKKIFLVGMLVFFFVGILFSQSSDKKRQGIGGRQATGYISYEECLKDEVCKATLRKEDKGGISATVGWNILSPKTYPRLYGKYKNNLFVIGGFILFFLILALWIYRKTTKMPL